MRIEPSQDAGIPGIQTRGLTHRYGETGALFDVDLQVPEGSVYALLGPNGAGKTTLLRILMNLLRPTAGQVFLQGMDGSRLPHAARTRIGYVAEGQPLPGGMTLGRLEAWLAPLYPEWDPALADDLRRRFRLDAGRKIRTLSRGEKMKAALLCALAPRPRLLILDEPFTGMDAVVKDELVRGVLETAGSEGWTVLISSHDIAELEVLSDWVGFLDEGRLKLSEPMEALHDRFRKIDVVSPNGPPPLPDRIPDDWLALDRAGPRLSFLLSSAGIREEADLRGRFPEPSRIEMRRASLREIFVALARKDPPRSRTPEATP